MRYFIKKFWKYCLVVSVILVFLLILNVINSPVPARKIAQTHIGLELYRHSVQRYKETVGQYPESLVSMHEYANKNPNTKIEIRELKEYISSSKGLWAESAKLDGSGGWFYDPNSGDVRVNLIHPLEHYLFPYFKRDRNEVPSEW